MILFFCLLTASSVDLEALYEKATTRLVSFQAVRDSAIEEFVRMGKAPSTSDTTIIYLVSKFDTKSSIERHTLKDILKEIGISAVKWIVHKLDYRGSGDEARALKQSLWVLGEIGGAEIVEPAARFIADESWAVRSAAFTTLGKSKSYEAVDFVVKGLSDAVALVRKSAYYALSEIATEREFPNLLDGLTDDFYGVRYAALAGIVMLNPQPGLLLAELGDDDSRNYFVLSALAEIEMEYDSLSVIKAFSPATRKALYDIFPESLLARSLEHETHPLLKIYLNKKICAQKQD